MKRSIRVTAPLTLLVAALLLAAAGCAGPRARDQGAQAAAPSPEEKVLNLKAGSYFFTPPSLTLPAGAPAAFRILNESSLIPHSFVLAGPDGRPIVRSELVTGGETIVRVPALPAGTYTFYCDHTFLGMSHRKKGMEGTLEVTPAGAGAAPASR